MRSSHPGAEPRDGPLTTVNRTVGQSDQAPELHQPGRAARFSPFVALTARGRNPDPLKVLYASDTETGALSETVFRNLRPAGPKKLGRSRIQRDNLSHLVASRDLKFVDLTSHGLSRLKLTRKDIIESGSRSYPKTALLAQAVHHDPGRYDGMVWVSRQHDRSLGVVLFGGRVQDDELDTTGPTFPLAFGHGRETVDKIADDLLITLIDPCSGCCRVVTCPRSTHGDQCLQSPNMDLGHQS
jgi:hypothetical protein